VSLVLRVGVELVRHPHLRRRPELPEVERPQHADDRVRLAAERDALAHDMGIRAEARFPQAAIDDGDAWTVGRVFFRRERAAQDDRRAGQLEEVSRHAAGLELLRERPAGVVHHPAGVERRHVLDDVGLLAIVGELGG